MKRLYIIGGTMGIGKTSACRQLQQDLPYSVFLDGDWCWDSSPFQATEETKEMVVDNICHLLNNFLRCSVYENIIFCWVMHQQDIIDSILERLNIQDCDTRITSLIADEKTVIERLRKDIASGLRSFDVIQRSIERLPLYQNLHTIKIDTRQKTIQMIADEIRKI